MRCDRLIHARLTGSFPDHGANAAAARLLRGESPMGLTAGGAVSWGLDEGGDAVQDVVEPEDELVVRFVRDVKDPGLDKAASAVIAAGR